MDVSCRKLNSHIPNTLSEKIPNHIFGERPPIFLHTRGNTNAGYAPELRPQYWPLSNVPEDLRTSPRMADALLKCTNSPRPPSRAKRVLVRISLCRNHHRWKNSRDAVNTRLGTPGALTNRTARVRHNTTMEKIYFVFVLSRISQWDCVVVFVTCLMLPGSLLVILTPLSCAAEHESCPCLIRTRPESKYWYWYSHSCREYFFYMLSTLPRSLNPPLQNETNPRLIIVEDDDKHLIPKNNPCCTPDTVVTLWVISVKDYDKHFISKNNPCGIPDSTPGSSAPHSVRSGGSLRSRFTWSSRPQTTGDRQLCAGNVIGASRAARVASQSTMEARCALCQGVGCAGICAGPTQRCQAPGFTVENECDDLDVGQGSGNLVPQRCPEGLKFPPEMPLKQDRERVQVHLMDGWNDDVKVSPLKMFNGVHSLHDAAEVEDTVAEDCASLVEVLLSQKRVPCESELVPEDCEGVQVSLLETCGLCGLQDEKEVVESHREACPTARQGEFDDSFVDKVNLAVDGDSVGEPTTAVAHVIRHRGSQRLSEITCIRTVGDCSTYLYPRS
ncbi:hypothetical protein J6590_070969 [Homalodisca vitripennis]|nr:hypothetical protein J6590_070969 [Homalodisca vitripennis]